SGNNPVSASVTGYSGDVVGDGINFDAGFYQTDVFTIAADHTSTTKPVLYLDDDQSTLGGIRYDNGSGQRVVYLDLNFGLVPAGSASQAQNLIVKSMNFLLGVASVKTSSNAASFTASNYPNPAVNSTKFTYSITDRAPVSLVVRDVMGREVANVVSNETQDMGTYEADMDCSKLASGTYFYTLTAGNQTVTNVLNVVK
ncbi:MAG TPA: T9SS type A sorting domain-containing protein, partial [Candidatus Kapabacteria bacterium]|nr:T9SS type A sorting domain-containing protein [Candidatus Kapabacteria bacterium]